MAEVQVPHSHIPYGKEGSGFYSDNHIACFNVVDAATPMALNALEKVPVKSLNVPFVIADFGTADGGTSMILLKKMIELLRVRHGKDLPVQVVYEDQPVNDFKSLFFRVQGLLSHAPPSYMQEFDNVYVLASGTSFYSQCLPPGSLHFGMSFTAMHWLSTRPCRITGALHFTEITDYKEKAVFQAQAAKDWETILLARAKELRSGGRMVVINLAIDKEGQSAGTTKNIKESVFHSFTKYWKEMATEGEITQVGEHDFNKYWKQMVTEGEITQVGEHDFNKYWKQIVTEGEITQVGEPNFNKNWKQIVTEGEITQEEFDNTNFNMYYRTVEECSAPFCDPNSAVSKSGLKLLAIETKVVRCPFHEKWIKSGRKADQEAAADHARRCVRSPRTWSNSTFLSGLDSSRSEEEKAAIVDKFFLKYEKAVASAPEDHGVDFVHAYMDIEKV
ncbi:gibberellic acid methyltransferase 2-like [Lingula anatina]|uniref:Gibberellic acid methyltransferase 2-like n=1 Tax=Lingula anatina TaxID=7574 RepID=A0A1S3ILX3_LINAN|nr:gibberellic acid methyltransferase 2-like [Lingula anatina]|eukprot:XP_013398519.1 gibberellic acid methyltransferase 2-like [Lingula anatina]